MTYAYDGDSSWLGWTLTSGRWYHGPAQVDVSTAFTAGTITIESEPDAVAFAP